MKGIVLAGGSGTRLYPITKGVSKQLLPIFDKSMIFYPLSVLMLAGIRKILFITTADVQRLLEDGAQLGISLKYSVQASPDGLAQAFIIDEEFIGSERVCLVLGDNIFYGQGFTPMLLAATERTAGATVFDCQVKDLVRFGVVKFDEHPSLRGKLEITCINQVYMEHGDLHVQLLGRGFAWLDTGPAHFVETIEKRQGYKVACLEDIAFKNGWL